MNKKIIYAIFFTLVLILSACGSNEKQDGPGIDGSGNGSTVGSITTSIQSMTIDQNSGNINANINLTSTYPNTSIANLSALDINLGGCSLQTGSVAVSPSTVILDKTTPTKTIQVLGVLSDPSCVPTNFYIKGTNTLDTNGKTEESPFKTNTVDINSNTIKFEKLSTIKLEVLDKNIDINESGITKPIRVRVTKDGIGLKDQSIKITSIVSDGSFNSPTNVSDAGGDATFDYISPAVITNKSFIVDFCLEDNVSICDSVNITLTAGAIVEPVEPIDNINYFITFVPNGGANNLALNGRNNAIVTLIDKDTREPIPNSRIKSIRVTTRDASVLKLTPEGGGTPDRLIQFGANRNAVSVLLTADRVNSGLAVLEVVIEYANLNGVAKTRGQLFTVAVLSGEPTAFSINGAGVSYNFDTKQFEHKFIVQATDLTGNPIATTGVINVSAMASFAKDAAGNEILYGRSAKDNNGTSATLSPNGEKATLNLVGLSPFNSTDIKLNRAYVAIFGDVETYEANGKWSIESIVSGNTLNLNNEYHGIAHDGLGMAVGYNFRDKICTSGYEESVVVVDSSDGTYVLDASGQAFVTLKYDSYMIGKRAMILVNMSGFNPNTGKVIRTGETHAVTLRFHDALEGRTVSVKGGTTRTFTHHGVITTGSADKHPLVNSSFSCDEVTGTTNIDVVSRTFSEPSSCVNGGQAYIIYTITTTTGEDGSFSLSNCTPDNNPPY